MGLHSGQTKKPTSHPGVSALKICISSKRLRSEVGKKALVEIQSKTKFEAIKSEVKKRELFHRHSTFIASLSLFLRTILYLLTF